MECDAKELVMTDDWPGTHRCRDCQTFVNRAGKQNLYLRRANYWEIPTFIRELPFRHSSTNSNHFNTDVCRFQSHTRPAPFSDEKEALHELQLCDYRQRLTYENAISGQGTPLVCIKFKDVEIRKIGSSDVAVESILLLKKIGKLNPSFSWKLVLWTARKEVKFQNLHFEFQILSLKSLKNNESVP